MVSPLFTLNETFSIAYPLALLYLNETFLNSINASLWISPSLCLVNTNDDSSSNVLAILEALAKALDNVIRAINVIEPGIQKKLLESARR